MKRTRSILTRKSTIFALVVLTGLGLVFMQFVLRPWVRRWRTHMEEVPLAGATLSVRDFGQGSPAVVIISGMACHKDSYYHLQKALAEVTRVISYDRPGLGDSTANHDPRTLDVIDRDLKALLELRRVPPPYIMIGHSLGGHIIRYYAHEHPGEVVGLVFLDHPHEDWFRYIRQTWPKDEAAEYFKFWSPENKDFVGVDREEMLAYEKNCDMVRGMKIDPDMSVLMFTANSDGQYRTTSPEHEQDRQAWTDMQASLLEGVKDAELVVDWEAGHMLHREKPEVVNQKVIHLIEQVRKKLKARASK